MKKRITLVLLVILMTFGGAVGYQKLQDHREQQTDESAQMRRSQAAYRKEQKATKKSEKEEMRSAALRDPKEEITGHDDNFAEPQHAKPTETEQAKAHAEHDSDEEHDLAMYLKNHGKTPVMEKVEAGMSYEEALEDTWEKTPGLMSSAELAELKKLHKKSASS